MAGVLRPWNYPLFPLIGPLTSALAAGNLAMVKLSEPAPRFAALGPNWCRTRWVRTWCALCTVAGGGVGVFFVATWSSVRHSVDAHPHRAAGDHFTGVATNRHFIGPQQPIVEATAAGVEASVVMCPARDGRRKLPLTVLAACSNDVRVMQQDLFGPVLPLVATDSLDAAIAYVNGAFIEPDASDPVAARAWRAQPKS